MTKSKELEEIDNILSEVNQRVSKSTSKDLKVWGEILSVLSTKRQDIIKGYNVPELTKEEIIKLKINGE